MSDELSLRRRGLIALAVLLPAVVWMSVHEDLAIVRQNRATEAIEVEPGRAASFAGVDWHLLDLKANTPEKTPDSTQVEARLQITVSSLRTAQAMRDCRPYLEDSTGQRWSAQPSRRGEISCANLSSNSVPYENPVTITERFVIPTHRAAEVRLAIIIPKQRPRYLRFRRS